MFKEIDYTQDDGSSAQLLMRDGDNFAVVLGTVEGVGHISVSAHSARLDLGEIDQLIEALQDVRENLSGD